jgi:phosphoenolpyruvate-protein phosphotransferase (PTS system enzyme I)
VGELGALNDPWQPAVLRLVALAARASQAAGKPIGVCGEAAADPLLAAVLVGLGVGSLSMSPRAIAAVAATIGGLTLAQCESAAAAATSAATAAEARQAVVSIIG